MHTSRFLLLLKCSLVERQLEPFFDALTFGIVAPLLRYTGFLRCPPLHCHLRCRVPMKEEKSLKGG
ncbi:hypothetical protein Ancab_013472, partial [Ancistrocladus abbreviatus]